MSIKVVARIRPLLGVEAGREETIVEAGAASNEGHATKQNIIRLPNPRNASENYSFHFNSVYDAAVTQQQLFDNEIAPTVKHLFTGFDVTIFAYGVTGSGKTHTMRGGKTLADRGMIPRLLSGIYRRGRKVEKDSNNATIVEVSMSYYEIYNDRVYDLFEPPERRTNAGLPIRDNNGKTVVAGLTERPCSSLKEFEQLYDQANMNRSTFATKLNAHSSRSHAILSVKVSQVTNETIVSSTISAIDLAGSEDNRRTGNDKERLVESSAINKSLFVLAQCVEAISKKQSRIPYRESKMTRILSLGQNNGLTIMILNLAPTRPYHLDTLSSLNFANRTKKIEVREVENEPVYRGPAKQLPICSGPSVQRPALRPIAANIGLKTATVSAPEKPVKAFTVYADKSRPSRSSENGSSTTLKRSAETASSSRPSKIQRMSSEAPVSSKTAEAEFSRSDIEALVNKMVDEKLACRAPLQPLSDDLQHRLNELEQRVAKTEDERSEGLQFLLMAKQHQAHGEDASALRMYRLALPFFPNNEKLLQRMSRLEEKLHAKQTAEVRTVQRSSPTRPTMPRKAIINEHDVQASSISKHRTENNEDNDNDIDKNGDPDYNESASDASHDELSLASSRPRKTKRTKIRPVALKLGILRDIGATGDFNTVPENASTPRTARLLDIINTGDITQIKCLKGLGVKRAEAIVQFLCERAGDTTMSPKLHSLQELEGMKGVGAKTVEGMRSSISV